METKTIKRFSIAMFLIAFVLMLGAVFALPKVVLADTAEKSTSDTLTINYSEANYEIEEDGVGKYIIIPSTNGTRVATTANGAKRQATISDVGNKMYLVGNVSGYNVVYSKTNANGVVATETITINLEAQDASFSFENNSEQIIPTQVQRSKQNTIVFPYPFIYEGEESDEAINVNPETLKPTDVAGLTVTLTSPNATAIALTKNSDGYYFYTVPADAKFGKYTVRYVYKTATTQTVAKSLNFTVKDGEVEQEIQISEFSSSMPSSMALFVETELPKPVVVNQNKSEVSVYTKLYLNFTPSLTEDIPTIYTNDYSKKGTVGYTYTPSLNEFKFTPTVAGTFTVSYLVEDFFGSTAQTSSAVNAITARKTAESGSGYVVEAYADYDAEKALIESGDYLSAEYLIPSRVNVANTEDLKDEDIWTLPAIFGIDKQTTDSSKLTYERIVRYTDSSNNSIKISFLNSGNDQKDDYIYTASGTYKADANKEIRFRFVEETEYTVEYVVRDLNSNTLFDKTFVVKVESGYTDTINPTVKFEGLSSTTVVAGKVLKFKVIGTDLAADSTVADSRLKMEVKAQINAEEPIELYADEEGFYTFDTKDLDNLDVVKITAVATDDYGNKTTTGNTRTINIKKITGANDPSITDFDFDPAEWTISGDTLGNKTSGDTITLPEVTINDMNGNNNLSVKVTAKVGSTIVYQNSFNSGMETFVELGNETFVATRSGDYVVNYVVTDAAKNKIVKSFIFTVVGPEKAIINLGSFDASYEYGTEINLRNLSVTLQTNAGSEDITDECEIITNISPTATEADIKDAARTQANIGPAILCQLIGDYELTDDESVIKAGQNGSVTINYWAVGHWDAVAFESNFTKEPKTATFTVSDTTKPTITVDEDLMEDVVPYVENPEDVSVNYVKIADMLNVWDLSGIQDGSVKISAKYNGASKDLEIIKYNGTLSTATETFVVQGNKVTINTVVYTFDEEAQTFVNGANVYDIVDGEVIINAVTYTFEIDDSGYYGYFKANQNGVVTVTYTATDNMGNTQTQTYSITVGDVTAPEINATEVEKAVQSANYKKGDTVSVDLTKLVIIEEVSDLDYTNVTVTVTRDGEEVQVDISTDKKTAEFKVDDYGTYTINFDVTDKAGYSADTAKVSFSVSNSSSGSSTNSTTIWGTILIVVILIALGVIIFLFAKPTKSKQKVKIEQKKDEEKKNDKIEV